MNDTKKAFRPTAVPLITVDPFFSLWSFSEDLTFDHVRHWSGRRQGMYGILRVDKKAYSFLGKPEPDDEMYYKKFPCMKQTALKITPTSTCCTMETDEVVLDFSFTTPLVLDRLDILSRPITYFEYSIRSKDGKEHNTVLYIDLAPECVTSDKNQKIEYRSSEVGAYFGRVTQQPLSRSGDRGTIDWGYIHIAHPEVYTYPISRRKEIAYPWFEYEPKSFT